MSPDHLTHPPVQQAGLKVETVTFYCPCSEKTYLLVPLLLFWSLLKCTVCSVKGNRFVWALDSNRNCDRVSWFLWPPLAIVIRLITA